MIFQLANRTPLGLAEQLGSAFRLGSMLHRVLVSKTEECGEKKIDPNQLTGEVMVWCLGLEGSIEAKSSISELQFTEAESFPEDCLCSVELEGLEK